MGRAGNAVNYIYKSSELNTSKQHLCIPRSSRVERRLGTRQPPWPDLTCCPAIPHQATPLVTPWPTPRIKTRLPLHHSIWSGSPRLVSISLFYKVLSIFFLFSYRRKTKGGRGGEVYINTYTSFYSAICGQHAYKTSSFHL